MVHSVEISCHGDQAAEDSEEEAAVTQAKMMAMAPKEVRGVEMERVVAFGMCAGGEVSLNLWWVDGGDLGK